MEAGQGKVRLYQDGLIANDIHLVFKKWIIDQKDISMILADSTTVFASLSNVVGSKDIVQCRKLLGLRDDVDLALIFIITMANTRFIDKEVVTSWIGSDLQNSSIKVIIRGELTPELREVGVGTVCAILNPNIREQVISSDLKSVTIKQLDDILLIGQLDGLKPCKAITTKGDMCKNLVYVHNQGEFCKYHVKFAKQSKKPDRSVKKSDVFNKTSNLKTKHEVIKATSTSGASRTYVEAPTKQFTLAERVKPAKPAETIAKLGDLNHLMQKIMNKRTVSNVSTASTNVPGLVSATPAVKSEPIKAVVDHEACREFEKLADIVRDYLNKDSKEYNKLLGTVQLMVRKLRGVTNEVVGRSQIMKTCDRLLDHPLENIAISALKLRRAIKRSVKVPSKDQGGEYTVTRMNTGLAKGGTDPAAKTEKTKEQVLNELEGLIGLSSSVGALVEKEKAEKLNERLKHMEKLDRTEEFKRTIKFIEVQAYYCRECERWFESVNHYCKQENHTLSKKTVKKEYHMCINKSCGYRYYSLNGQKPSRCPKCKETTVVSEATSFYKPRPDYLLPNEKLLEGEVGASRPLNSDS